MSFDPVIGAQRMQAAERRRGVEYGDDCKKCRHRVEAWGAEYCMKGHEITKKQFHKCVKHGTFLRV